MSVFQGVGPFNSGAAVGNDGAATVNTTHSTPTSGMLMGFHVRYNDSPPATTDVTIEATGGVLPARTLLTLTNINTSGFYAVRAAEYKSDGTVTGAYVPLVLIGDKIKVTIAGANAGDNVDVWAVVL